jgi:hypothetical protein
MKESSEASQDLEDVARRVAARQAEAIQRYGSLLSQFGSAKISSRDFGEGVYKFTLDESVRSFGEFVDLGMRYWRSVLGAAEPVATAAQSAARSASRTMKARSRKSRGSRKGTARQAR